MEIDSNKLKFSDAPLFGVLYCGVTYEMAEYWYYQGRFTEYDWRIVCLVFEWSTFRFSSDKQGRFYNKLGYDALKRRFARTQKLLEAYMVKRFGYAAK